MFASCMSCQRDESEGVEASMVLVGKLTFVFFMYAH